MLKCRSAEVLEPECGGVGVLRNLLVNQQRLVPYNSFKNSRTPQPKNFELRTSNLFLLSLQIVKMIMKYDFKTDKTAISGFL